MTEQVPPPAPDQPGPEALRQEGRGLEQDEPAGEPTLTGVPAVDEVLADVDRLADVPLEEHVAAFERAHESLRSALDSDPGDPA